MSGGASKALLLDVGVVLFVSAWELLDEFERWKGLPPGTLPWRGALDPAGDAEWQRHLAGEITEGQYWFAFADRCQSAGADPAPFDHVMRAIFQGDYAPIVRHEARGLVDDVLAAGRPYGILTNELTALHGETWVRSRREFSEAHVLVDADALGVRKPDPRAYLAAIDGLGVPAANIVFVDDNRRYVDGAIAVGIDAIWLDVRDPGEAFAEARARLGLA